MKDMLTVSKQQDFDVFNALDSMDNAEFLKVSFKIYLKILKINF